MSDAERALHALLHDLRTPIGVAQGYLRLLQERRLQEDADRERAIAQALRALNETARLCDQAADALTAPQAESGRPATDSAPSEDRPR